MIHFTFEENNTKSFETAFNNEANKVVSFYQKELTDIRTGRAHTSLVEDVKVIAYEGSEMRLKDVAALSAPDARLIVIQPWDKGLLGAIEKGIIAASIGLTPIKDADLIRITLPEMSTQRREELIKQVTKKAEDTRTSIRSIRKDFLNLTRDAERSKKISEDFANRLNDLLQKMTDKQIALVDQMTTKKESEIRG